MLELTIVRKDNSILVRKFKLVWVLERAAYEAIESADTDLIIVDAITLNNKREVSLFFTAVKWYRREVANDKKPENRVRILTRASKDKE